VDEVETLIGIAQIGVAIAGFATLASILGRRFSRDDPRTDVARLRSMLDISLAAAALSLFPILPMKLGVSSETVWRISSLVFLVTISVMAFSIRRRNRELDRLRAAYSNAFSATSFVVAGALGVVLLASALGMAGLATFSTYYAALLVNLVFSGLLFIRIFASLVAAPPSEPS
jgi:hypothetical protein